MAKKMSGLGRGVDALFPSELTSPLLVADGERIVKLSLTKIVADPDQPRKEFDAEALAGLAASLQQYGVLQPLIVQPEQGGMHRIIAGERRFRAAGIAGLSAVPVIIRSSKEQEHQELALIENVQRVDLSPLEQAASIERLHQQFNVPYEQIASRLGKAPSTITNIVRLLQLPPEATKALASRAISEGHARAILALREQPDQQALLLDHIVTQGWSVRQAERFVTAVKAGNATKAVAEKRVSTETPETTALAQRLGAPVALKRTAKGGRIEISFASDDELAALLKRLG